MHNYLKAQIRTNAQCVLPRCSDTILHSLTHSLSQTYNPDDIVHYGLARKPKQPYVPTDVSRDFGPELAFGTKVQITAARQWGREMR